MKANKKCLVVLGMHRSGTSALAGLLHHLGIELGSDLLPAVEDENPKGFFENNNIFQLNERILRTLNSSWDSLSPLPDGWWNNRALDKYREAAKNIMQTDFDDCRLFAIKDPRLCLLLPLWQEAFDELNIEVIYLLNTRHPLEIAASLEKRDHFSHYKSFLLWLNHTFLAELYSRNHPRIFIPYDELLNNHENTLQIITDTCKIDVSKSYTSRKKEIELFLTKDLKHFNFNKTNSKPVSFPFVSTLQQSLGRLADRDLKEVRDTIDRERKNYINTIHRFLDKEFLFNLSKDIKVVISAIYVDSGNGYSEQETVFLKADFSVKKFELSFDLSGFSKINAVRWDPVERNWCRVRIEQISLLYTDHSIHQIDLKTIDSNGIKEENETFLFQTLDPNFYIPVRGAVNRIIIRGEWESLSKELIETIYKKTLANKNVTEGQIKQLNADILQQKNQILRLDEQLAGKDQRIAQEIKIVQQRNAEINLLKESIKKLGDLNNEKDKALYRKDKAINEKDVQLCVKDELLGKKDQVIYKKDEALVQKDKFNKENEKLAEAKERQIRERDMQITKIRKDLGEKENEIVRLEALLKIKDELIKNHQVQITALTKAISVNEKIIISGEEGLNKLGIKLSETDALLIQKEQIIDEKEKLIKTLKVNLNAKEQLSTEIKRALAQKDELLNQKDQELNLKGDLVRQREEHINALNNEVKVKEHYISNLKKSLSYRVGFGFTYPLRKLYDWNRDRKYYNVIANVQDGEIKSEKAEENQQALTESNATEQIGILLYCEDIKFSDGFIEVSGWAIADAGIDRIEVFIDELFIGNAEYGYCRPDIEQVYPNVPNSVSAGFHLKRDLANHISSLAQNHRVLVKAVDKKGEANNILKENIKYNYHLWIEQNEPSQEQLEKQRKAKHISNLKFSIILMIRKPAKQFLIDTLESVINQTYGNWELIVLDCESKESHVKATLLNYSKNEKRIKIKHAKSESGGIENIDILSAAEGDYITFIQEENMFPPFALYEVSKNIQNNPRADFIYSDEDMVADNSIFRFAPHFKPDFNSYLLRSMNYIGNLVAINRELLDKAHKIQVNYCASDRYDLLLKVTELAERIIHIPKILYHNRQRATITGVANELLHPLMALNGTQVKTLITSGNGSQIEAGTVVSSDEKQLPFSLVILNKNSPEFIIPLLKSLKTGILNTYYEVIVGDTGTTDQEVLDYYKQVEKEIKIIRDLDYHFGKNYNSLIKEYSRGRIVGIMNNDIILPNVDILRIIEDALGDEEIGAVGATLLYPDGTVQHGGVFFFENGQNACMGYHRLHGKSPKKLQEITEQYVPAITGAFIFCKRENFLFAGGFDEYFKEECQDLDFCLKLRRLGKAIVIKNIDGIIHIENGTRPKGSENWDDRRYFLWKWRTFIESTILGTELNKEFLHSKKSLVS